MNEKEFVAELLAMTEMVEEARAGLLSPAELQQRYGDYYYSYPLDGHEEDEEGKAVLEKYNAFCEFHRRIQTEVVDELRAKEPLSAEFRAAGRIDESEARQRIERLARELRLPELLSRLRRR